MRSHPARKHLGYSGLLVGETSLLMSCTGVLLKSVKGFIIIESQSGLGWKGL